MSVENASMDEELIELLVHVELLAKRCEINQPIDSKEIVQIIKGIDYYSNNSENSENIVHQLSNDLLDLKSFVDKNEDEEDDSCESIPGWASKLLGTVIDVAKLAGITYITTMATTVAEEYGKDHGHSLVEYLRSKQIEHKNNNENQAATSNTNTLIEGGQQIIEKRYRRCAEQRKF